jgi:hypothetical protein
MAAYARINWRTSAMVELWLKWATSRVPSARRICKRVCGALGSTVGGATGADEWWAVAVEEAVMVGAPNLRSTAGNQKGALSPFPDIHSRGPKRAVAEPVACASERLQLGLWGHVRFASLIQQLHVEVVPVVSQFRWHEPGAIARSPVGGRGGKVGERRALKPYPRETAARNAALRGSSMARSGASASGPSSTVKPLLQKVTLTSWPRKTRHGLVTRQAPTRVWVWVGDEIRRAQEGRGARLNRGIGRAWRESTDQVVGGGRAFFCAGAALAMGAPTATTGPSSPDPSLKPGRGRPKATPEQRARWSALVDRSRPARAA